MTSYLSLQFFSEGSAAARRRIPNYMNPNLIAEAQAARSANIIEMALEFAGMTRVFSKQSTGKIIGTLARLFTEFGNCVQDHQTYERLHAEFCHWCTENIWTARSPSLTIRCHWITKLTRRSFGVLGG